MNTTLFIGFWKLIEADPSLELGDGDEMEFKESGELIYAIDSGSKWQIMNLIFKIEGNYLITDQPSSPNEERTVFNFHGNNLLVLDYGGAKAKYQRINERSFPV